MFGNMPRKEPLSLSGNYRTRGGREIVGLEVVIPLSNDIEDGFPFRYWVQDGDRMTPVWVNRFGQWSSNPYAISPLDLVPND
jgi:hypothetical protein